MSVNFASNSATEGTGALSYILGNGLVSQLLLGIVLCTIVYIVLMSIEILYKSFKSVKGTRVRVLDKTVSSETRPLNFQQNPNLPKNKLLPLSDNELTGAEFTYSFFLWINPASIEGNNPTTTMRHIMHKGNPLAYPLMGPGVFLKSTTNTLRFYMNSSKTWNNYVEVDNVPMNKWVHIALVLRKDSLEIYINGNLDRKLSLDGATVYQNFGDLHLFSDRTIALDRTRTPSIEPEDSLTFDKAFQGRLSNLNYFSYAVSYTEIQALIAEGISKETELQNEERPPYLQDQWWVTSYGP
jgi:hypothetical protein